MQLIHTVLPRPPSINSAYRTTSRSAVIYKTKVAKDWHDRAVVIIQQALQKHGFGTAEPGDYWWAAVYKANLMRLDGDNPGKLIHDAVKEAIGIDDNQLGGWGGSKWRVHSRIEEMARVWIAVTPVVDDRDFNVRGDAFTDEMIAALAATKGNDVAWTTIDLSQEFNPISKETQAKGKRDLPTKSAQRAKDKEVYDAVTEEARDPKTGWLICALCGLPGPDNEMHRDHIQAGTARKTTKENVRIVHAACHMESHQTGKREPKKTNALTDGIKRDPPAKKATTRKPRAKKADA